MKRAVVTGIGIVSSIGNNRDEVIDSLRNGRSGIVHAPVYEEMGFRSHVHGPINLDLDEVIDRKVKRFMGDGAAYNYLAMEQAIADSGLSDDEVSNIRTGLVMVQAVLLLLTWLTPPTFCVVKALKKWVHTW